MIRSTIRVLLILGLWPAAVSSAIAGDASLDLSSWTELTLDLPGGRAPGNWVLSADNTSVTQTINADPSFFISDDIAVSYTMNGTWVVETGSDDDLMGFAFGYQDPGHCYIMDWKQSAQSLGGYGSRRRVRDPKDARRSAAMTIADYWSHLDGQERYTILATSLGATLGWGTSPSTTSRWFSSPGNFG